MVFLVGPRQVGKTTIARSILSETQGVYFNWDFDEHRAALRANKLDPNARLWVFDEIHKFRTWRNWLKGQFDVNREHKQILVTGSARLDVYHRGGDSLAGRFFLHRLSPLTASEVERPNDAWGDLSDLEQPTRPPLSGETVTGLMALGGFPEPFYGGSARNAARWRSAYGTTLVREDIRDLENLRDLDRLELLFDRLPGGVGSVLSINALREDLEVAFQTVRNWVTILEKTYAVFRIPPFGPPKIKAVKKEQKLYMWDWGRVEAQAARFENLIAVHLLRLCHWAEDVLGERLELRYFRDVSGHEVDFVLLKAKKPWVVVEAKTSDGPTDRGLNYLLERMDVPHAFQVSLQGSDDFETSPIRNTRVRHIPANRFLALLP